MARRRRLVGIGTMTTAELGWRDLAYMLAIARAAERAVECGRLHNMESAMCSCGLDELQRALEDDL